MSSRCNRTLVTSNPRTCDPLSDVQSITSLPSGATGTFEHKILLLKDGKAGSYWHDIPLPYEALDADHIVPMVIEIPHG